MPKVTIENREYELDDLPKEAQTQIANVSFCDEKLNDMKREMALVQTARSAYLRALQRAMPKDG